MIAYYSRIGLVFCSTFLSVPTCFAQLASIVDMPDASAEHNAHYVGNRSPLLPSLLIKLPVGAVRPKGWLEQQLLMQADGFHGHLGEISKFLKKDGNAWLDPQGSGQYGWEEVPYWLKGFGDCAYLLGREDQIKEAKLWLEGAIRSQREDGYFGPGHGTKSTVKSTSGKYDLWPNMVMLMCLQSYHEFTGDPRVVELMKKYFKWQLNVPDQEFLPPYWQQQRAGDNLWSVLWLYNRIGEPWLLDLATKIHKRTANWTDGIPNWHNVNMAQAFGGPAFYWQLSKENKHLEAAERNWRTMRDLYGQVPGGMFGGDENCRRGLFDPRQAIETCGMAEMMFSNERLLTTTGNLVWADRCEDVAFNSMPAALTADFKALRYLTAPNHVLSDKQSKSPGIQNGGPMYHMNPHIHRCCQHNFGHAWPYFAEYLWCATPGNGLAAVLYSPGEVRAKVGSGVEVVITTKTDYPFDEAIEFMLTTLKPVSFPLYLRIPGWCSRAAVVINGESLKVDAKAGKFLRLSREWKNGDSVRLTLPMDISLRVWEKNKGSVSVDRGPLTYALKIGEQYIQDGKAPWFAWEIHPTTPWNYGLKLDAANPSASFELVKKPFPKNQIPFTHEGNPLELRAKGRRIPQWTTDERGLVKPLPVSPVPSSEADEQITLIPMGAARLRVSSFPVVGEQNP
jgi:hypothetical protein